MHDVGLNRGSPPPLFGHRSVEDGQVTLGEAQGLGLQDVSDYASALEAVDLAVSPQEPLARLTQAEAQFQAPHVDELRLPPPSRREGRAETQPELIAQFNILAQLASKMDEAVLPPEVIEMFSTLESLARIHARIDAQRPKR